jgi:hypothetical protein
MMVAEVARLAYHRPERLPPGLMPADLTTQNYDAAPGTGTWANARTRRSSTSTSPPASSVSYAMSWSRIAG